MRKSHPSARFFSRRPWRWLMWKLGFAVCCECRHYRRMFVAWECLITPNEPDSERPIGPYCWQCYGDVFRRGQERRAVQSPEIPHEHGER